MKSIILKGGLGNQLFQLTKFFDIYNKGFNDIKLDVFTGFLLDIKYKRKLEINNLNRNITYTTNYQNILNLFGVILYKFAPFLLRLLRTKVIDDNSSYELKKGGNKNIIYNGYFQNFKIVESNIEEIYQIIKPNFQKRKTRKFNKLISQIQKCENSVAIGIRFYEEAKDPLKHTALKTGIKKAEDFNRIIKLFEKNTANPKFFIFVQNENAFTRRLKFNSKFYIVSHAKGFLGSWERLTAQAHCKHHIFNNSTFYYWGAVFSRFLNQNKKIDSEIYISNNFIFDQIYNPEWKKF